MRDDESFAASREIGRLHRRGFGSVFSADIAHTEFIERSQWYGMDFFYR